jgi:hypothetical protein
MLSAKVQVSDHGAAAQRQSTWLETREAARRARRLALTLLAEADKARLTQFADELDKEAFERSAPTVSAAPVAGVAPSGEPATNRFNAGANKKVSLGLC